MLDLKKEECCGCGACEQRCPVNAIEMTYDREEFLYPVIDKTKCIGCGSCEEVCQSVHPVGHRYEPCYTFGGRIRDDKILEESTSGGAFSAICESWYKNDSVILGAVSEKLQVRHEKIERLEELYRFRKSKYIQSRIGNSYIEVKKCLKQGKRVLFSGTPCQIAGLLKFVEKEDLSNLLTVEVVCEGVPSPLWIKKQIQYVERKKNKKVIDVLYRDKNGNKWDFEFMCFEFADGSTYKLARWFNPFWSVWLKHLMSRPSCYKCPYADRKRTADITLGDLWGVHIYCPELYEKNKGASLVICNTQKGKAIWKQAEKDMKGHSLKFEDALKYQGPMRKCIAYNTKRNEFMEDIESKTYEELCAKWADKCSFKLWFQKYVWGNRQKVFVWNLLHWRKRSD